MSRLFLRIDLTKMQMCHGVMRLCLCLCLCLCVCVCVCVIKRKGTIAVCGGCASDEQTNLVLSCGVPLMSRQRVCL